MIGSMLLYLYAYYILIGMRVNFTGNQLGCELLARISSSWHGAIWFWASCSSSKGFSMYFSCLFIHIIYLSICACICMMRLIYFVIVVVALRLEPTSQECLHMNGIALHGLVFIRLCLWYICCVCVCVCVYLCLWDESYSCSNLNSVCKCENVKM